LSPEPVCIKALSSVAFVAWYDYDLTQYQKERQDTELEEVFETRNTAAGTHPESGEMLIKKKMHKEPETEWQQSVKNKKSEDYYTKIKEVRFLQSVLKSHLTNAI
jgi:titin